MRPFVGKLGALLAVVAALWGCSGARGPVPAEMRPIERARPAPAPLPDRSERLAAQSAAFVLAGRPDSAAAALNELQEEEARRRREGKPRTGLVDNTRDALNAASGPRGYRDRCEQMLEQELDPALERRIELHLEREPLHVAERRIREDRTRKVAATFNRLALPLSRFVSGGTANPLETGRAAIAALLSFLSFPEATPQERQALRAYQDFLERNPDSPEAEWVIPRMEHYQEKWLHHLHGEVLAAAERALDAGRPDVGLAHLEHAERLIPGESEAAELREKALKASTKRTEDVERALSATTVVAVPLGAQGKTELQGLLTATLTKGPGEMAERSRTFEERLGLGPLSDEFAFVSALVASQTGKEDAFFEEMGEVAKLRPEWSNMARHASWIRADPEQDPYSHYRHAVDADRKDRNLYILLGRYRDGPPKRNLPRPAEWILGAPGLAISVALMPLRVLRYRSAKGRFEGAVVDAGEGYLKRFPRGAHAEEVHRELEKRYAKRGQWSRALEHGREHSDADPYTLAGYRVRVADQALAAAQLERRWDIRAVLYRQVLQEHPDTPQADTARRELRTLLTESTPQNIRLSRDFLLENPELWGPGALGLRHELLDEDEENGELAEEGITLLGKTNVRIALKGREPVVDAVPAEQFARFVALLQEVYYHRLATDPRDRPDVDPQRDLFFERARLGLIENPDTRPTAVSAATFLSSREQHGMMQRRSALLPVELVVSGDLESFGLSAFPRILTPPESHDAWLYR